MTVHILALLPVALLAMVAGAWLAGRRKRARCAQHMASIALRDPQTGLLNQQAMLEALGRTLSLADRLHHPVTVLVVEIDGFAALAARLGPARTGGLERNLAQRMAARVRSHDLLGHWDRGRFLVVLPDADVASALVLVEDLRQMASTQPLEVAGEKHILTVSVGVHGRTSQPGAPLYDLAPEMVVAAQRALEATPGEGPNRIEIEP
jgi:diguanylate cyclase (GGDEF)-like protein